MWLRARARECWSWDALHRAVDLREAHHDAGAHAEAANLVARVYEAVADVHGRDDPPAHATTADLMTCVRRAVASALVVPCHDVGAQVRTPAYSVRGQPAA